MKFGVHLDDVQFSEWKFYYLDLPPADYAELKKKVKEMMADGDQCSEHLESEFVAYLERELEKVVNFQNIKFGELNKRAQQCDTIISNIIQNPTQTPQIDRIRRVEDEITRITLETNELAKFSRLNYTGFIKILKKHDKRTKFILKPTFMLRLNEKPFYRENFAELIIKLSKLYDVIRNGGQTESKNVQADGGSQAFVRKTTKYWVHPDNVTEVKLMVLKHLPVLIFGSTKDYDPAITSIYFDNDELELYKGRLEKSEGAEAIRFRWYGGMANQEIFIERKTHREDWTGEKSVKERFPLKEKNVDDFMKGNYDLERDIKKLRERSAKTEKELEDLARLSSEVRTAILEKKLKPTMRSFYNRTAFQLPGDARVRISLDTELCMIREDNWDDVDRAGDHWRRMDIGIDYPFSQLPESDICRFPYAILEVKLQTQLGAEPPAWVQELVAGHLVEEVPKFSKFIHGCATLLEKRVKLLPFWLPQMDNDIRKPAPATIMSNQPLPRHASTLNIEYERTLSARKGKGKARATVLPVNGGGSSSAVASTSGSPTSNSTGGPVIRVNGGAHDDLEQGSQSQYDEEETQEDDEDDANEQSLLLGEGSSSRQYDTQSKGKGILRQMKGLMEKMRVREEQEERTGPRPTVPHRHRDKRIAIPVRVEPKVFFANERTFLSWLNFATTIGALALGLLNFGDQIAQISGVIFTMIALGVMAYALYIYLWRAEMIRRRDAGPYDDKNGPVFIVIVLFAAMLINFYLKFAHKGDKP
ncbi:hypothetical protein RI367_003033 [Sorochytrium milnesiophthora]